MSEVSKNKSFSAHPVDVYVGKRILQRRKEIGYSQSKLAESVGLTFQQIQKYERATNRIGASRLFDLSRVLQVPVSYFFTGFKDRAAESAKLSFVLNDNSQSEYDAVNMTGASELDIDTQIEILTQSFKEIDDPQIRSMILELVQALRK